MQQAVLAPDVDLVGADMQAALVRLGLSQVAAQEFINNGVTSLNKLRVLTIVALDLLIKQMHRDN
jgi:hypothetical protein